VTPANSATKHLSYGRIRLDAEVPAVSFAAGAEEVGLVCLQGPGASRSTDRPSPSAATTPCTSARRPCRRADGHGRRPRGVPRAGGEPVPLRHVRYAEVVADPGLHFKAGGPSSSRTLNMLLAKNVEAGRLMAGVTWSEPGHWTSWPPHEHAALAEELYVYYDMPPEAFGIPARVHRQAGTERIEMGARRRRGGSCEGVPSDVAIPAIRSRSCGSWRPIANWRIGSSARSTSIRLRADALGLDKGR